MQKDRLMSCLIPAEAGIQINLQKIHDFLNILIGQRFLIFYMLLLSLILQSVVFGNTSPNADFEQRAQEFITAALGEPFSKISFIETPLICDTIQNDSTPFLRHILNGKKVYRLHLPWRDNYLADSIIFPNDSEPKGMIECVFDSTFQSILKITIKREPLQPSVDIDVPVERAEKQISSIGEIYVGFIPHTPQTSLVKALRAYSIRSRQIEAYYLMDSAKFYPLSAVWVLNFRGTPPLPAPEPASFDGSAISPIPIYMKNHTRVIINDATGNPSFSTSVPQPPFKDDDPIKKIFDEDKKRHQKK
jgi:hypothetical protein